MGNKQTKTVDNISEWLPDHIKKFDPYKKLDLTKPNSYESFVRIKDEYGISRRIDYSVSVELYETHMSIVMRNLSDNKIFNVTFI